MVASLLLAATLLFAAPKGSHDSALVGSWSLSGQPFVVFRADGTGTMDGENFTWTSDGKVVTLKSSAGETDQMSYVVKDGQLAVVAGGIPMALSKSGGAGRAADAKAATEAGDAPAKSAKSAKGAKGHAADAAPNLNDQLSKLLVSSAWCSFHYNQTAGTTNQSRVVFHPDGTWEKNARGETYSSGYGGTYASQNDSGDGGRWKVEKNQLMMSSRDTGGELAPLQLFVTKNSNGYPILNANGDEYSMCK